MPNKTGLVFFPAFDWAISPTHPEREERLLYTKDQLLEEGIFDLQQITEIRPKFATLKDIARVHASFPDIESNITEGHLASAGSAMQIAENIINKNISNGFALVRPPGHHAMHIVHGNRGFCNINNEAIMIDYLRKKHGLKKIAIVDTDVHHGDGTQNIYYHDPDVLFISLHQDGRTLYPGTGFVNELGGPKALGYTLNFPLPPGTTDEGFLYVLENAILPILKDFKPDLIVNSAGQDNHFTDPLARMQMSACGYARLNQLLAPDIAVLEGGYSIEGALPYVNLAIILAMSGLDYTSVLEPHAEIVPMTNAMRKEIQYLCENNLKLWNNKNSAHSDEFTKESSWYERSQNIFYDTDGIREKQNEKLSACTSCHGLKVVQTQASRDCTIYRALVLTLPFNACSKCRSEAEALYQKNKTSNYDALFYQDKQNDRYFYYYPSTEREEEV